MLQIKTAIFLPAHSAFIIRPATSLFPVLQATSSEPTCLLKMETLALILLHAHCKTANNVTHIENKSSLIICPPEIATVHILWIPLLV